MLFDSWTRLAELGVAAVAAYATLLASLRISGKRTLSKLNAFDLVVTIALGSVLATVVLSRSTALVEGLAAFAVLVALQYVVAASSLRSGRFRRLVKSSPTVLVSDGRLLEARMLSERVGADEVAEAVRKEGYGSFDQVELVVLETDGTLSVIADAGDGSALVGLRPVDTTDRRG